MVRFILLLVLFACSTKKETPTPEAVPVAPKAPEPVRQPTLLEQLNQHQHFDGSLKVAIRHFGDSRNEADVGAMTFAVWSTKHMVWASIQKQPETKHALVLKDPVSERGKKMCSSGTMIEIRVDRSTGNPIYDGGIMSNGGKVTRFMAVGSSGELVENSPARICGIVTGTYSYGNSAGGTTHAVNVVGMFDLPENK
jgi:hypothetical protein